MTEQPKDYAQIIDFDIQEHKDFMHIYKRVNPLQPEYINLDEQMQRALYERLYRKFGADKNK